MADHCRQGALPAGIDRVSAELSEVLASADYIVSSLPSTATTRGLLDGEALAATLVGRPASRPPPTLINIGRGDLLSEESVLSALAAGWLRGAVLDVFPTEPLPPQSKLWGHSAVRLTPHVSAVSFPADVAEIFARNLQHRLAGEPFEFEIDWAKGY